MAFAAVKNSPFHVFRDVLCRLHKIDSIASVAGPLGDAQLLGKSPSLPHGIHLADHTTLTSPSAGGRASQLPASPGDTPADIALVRMLYHSASLCFKGTMNVSCDQLPELWVMCIATDPDCTVKKLQMCLVCMIMSSASHHPLFRSVPLRVS